MQNALELKINEIISQMTLKEKIGQLVQLSAPMDYEGKEKLKNRIRNGSVGSVILAFSSTAGNDAQRDTEVEVYNELQRVAVEESRMGIPVIFGRDVIHGHRTVMPIPLASAGSFNPDLVEECYTCVAREAANDGVQWAFSPMVDVCHDPRWGRIIEGPGEDPYLASVMSSAIVKGFQGEDYSKKDRIAACVKHYLGYGASEGGRDYHRTELSDYTLYNMILPPFRAAVDAGVATVMSSFNDINGQPVTASKKYLTDILRGYLGFNGFVVSDWAALANLRRQGVAETEAECAAMALQAGLDMEKEDPYRVGVIVSSGIGSMQAHEREQIKFAKSGKIAPLYIPMMIANMASANIAIQYGMKGINTCVVTACATGLHSIGDAFKAVKYGDADVMITGGCEAAVCKTGIQGFAALTALSTNEDPETASRPFDKDRDGFVIGEGSGVLVIESYEHAKARGANILAEIVGYGATCDAYHITSPAEDGSGAGEAMIIAMKEAGIKPSEIDYINAHGTSTHHNDLFETRAMKYAFKEDIRNISINSTKSMIGHALGGAGGIELITCVKSILDGYVHVTAGSKESEGEMDLDYTFIEPKNRDITYAMTNNLGFGGHNASMIVKKFV